MKTTTRRVSLSLGLVLVLAVLGVMWTYERIAAPSNELHDQLQAMIANHDVSEMKALSIDESTKTFLENLKKDVSIQASDFQGGGHPQPHVTLGYFPAQLGNTSLNCYMVIHSNGFSLIPQWKLVKVSLNPVGIDPAWANGNS